MKAFAMLAAFVALALIAGCTSTGAPIREQDAIHRAPKPGWLITELGTIYVPPGTLSQFTAEPPATTVAAILAHERVHAARQVDRGGVIWAIRYAVSTAARWEEERLAYEAEIAELGRRGVAVASPYWRSYFVGLVLDPAYRGMVERAAAEKWYDGFVAAGPRNSLSP